jgi:hypothetical protein
MNAVYTCEVRNKYETLVENTEEKGPVRRSKRRWENIKPNLKGTGCEYVDLIHLAQDKNQWRAIENMVLNPLVP